MMEKWTAVKYYKDMTFRQKVKFKLSFLMARLLGEKVEGSTAKRYKGELFQFDGNI